MKEMWGNNKRRNKQRGEGKQKLYKGEEVETVFSSVRMVGSEVVRHIVGDALWQQTLCWGMTVENKIYKAVSKRTNKH